jgi:hypothetical protein
VDTCSIMTTDYGGPVCLKMRLRQSGGNINSCIIYGKAVTWQYNVCEDSKVMDGASCNANTAVCVVQPAGAISGQYCNSVRNFRQSRPAFRRLYSTVVQCRHVANRTVCGPHVPFIKKCQTYS